MGTVRGCNVPEDLHYHTENNVWLRRESDGSVTVGMTAYACALAGEIVSYTPKKAGKPVERNKSCATVESGKWVGPVKTPVGGEVIAVNEALIATPGLVNKDPYGQGWMSKLKPTNWDADAAALVTGADALGAFEKKMEADSFAGCK